jgi:hypothetical protein
MPTKKNREKKNKSKKGGMGVLRQLSRFQVPKQMSLKNSLTSSELKHLPFEFLNMPDETVTLHKLTKVEEKVIKDGIELIKITFKKSGQSKMLKSGWEEEFNKMVINLYSQAINENRQQIGGMLTTTSNSLVGHKPKFNSSNYVYILISIVFGITTIFFMVGFLSTINSVANFDAKAILESRQISTEMKEILCDAFSKGMESEGMNAMAKIWYALSCVVAPIRPESVTYYETKIINVVQHVMTNFMITTAKESTNLCVVQSSNPVISFANKFTGLFTGSGTCMGNVAVMSSEHKLREIKYITDAVSSSFYQKGYAIYALPALMYTSYKLCDNYRLKYLEAINTFRIANEEYESQLLAISPGVSDTLVNSPGRRRNQNPMAIGPTVQRLRDNANK